LKGGEVTLDIEIRYFAECPNWRLVREELLGLIAELGLDAEVRTRSVDTPDEAERLSFRGSPTIVIDGIDPWDEAEAPVGLSCRIYRTERGLSGKPTQEDLRNALHTAR
jgi:hypothetical protein